jgi:hypothetical protein
MIASIWFGASANKFLGNLCNGNRHAGIEVSANAGGGVSPGNTIRGKPDQQQSFLRHLPGAHLLAATISLAMLLSTTRF